MFNSLFKESFKAAKCKTLLQLATSRIKVLRNKRDVQLKQLKRELAKFLKTNQEPSAHIRVEHIYREQNIMAAYDVILLFCELLAARLSIIETQRHCPIDLREAVASIIFAAPRCSDIPELQQIRRLFSAKYGKEFTAVAAELRPDCGVNRVVIEKLSVKGPSIGVKLKLMKDIAMEQGLDWDPTDLASQNFTSPEDLLDGPSRFFDASCMSVQKSFEEPSTNEPISPQHQRNVVAEAKTPTTPVAQNVEFLDEKQFIPFVRPIVEDNFSSSDSQSKTMQQQSSSSTYSSHPLSANVSSHGFSGTFSQEHDKDDESHALGRRMSLKGVAAAPHFAHKDDKDEGSQCALDRRMSFKGVAAAVRAAAESAESAAAAARAAVLLASEKLDRNIEGSSSNSESDDDGEETSQLHESFEDDHLNLGRVPPEVNSTLRMPLFDNEPMKAKGNLLSFKESREEESVSYSVFSSESYNFDDTDSCAHSTTSMEGHVDDQASRQPWHQSISSSNDWGYQHNNTKFSKTMSFATAGPAPTFDTYDEFDGPGNKPADEAAHSKPPEQPPPPLPRAQPPTLTKSTTFSHPKLPPDYDAFIAQFQALKAMRSRE